MPEKLLLDAIAQAERSGPSVRGIALLRIARVVAVNDKVQAEELMERGIAVICALPENHRSILLNEAASLAGTVSPQRAFDLLPMAGPQPMPGRIDKVIFDFLSHGHIKEATEYLGQAHTAADYPFMAALNAMSDMRKDREAQLRILRGAIAAILGAEAGNSFAEMGFLHVFKLYWKILPLAETAEAVRKLVEHFLREPDQHGNMNAGGPAGQVHFSSTQQWRLFEIFAPLRSAAPEIAESLVRKFAQLAEAVEKFPNGYDETQGMEPAPVQEDAPKCGVDIEWDDVNFKWIPVSEWVERIFPQKFEQALAGFHADITPSPNSAPRECWPSTQEFRTLLYQSGRYEGLAAVKHLQRIPDSDVRLFAQIELCAAWAGLPQIGGSSIPRRINEPEKGRRPSSPMVTAESAKWKEQGRPRQVRVEAAQWEVETQTWAPPAPTFSAVYRPDRQPEQMRRQNPDGSVNQCEFDYADDGRPTAIWSALDEGPVEQTTYSYNDRERTVRIAKANPAPATMANEPDASEAGFSVKSSWVTVVAMDVREDSYEIADAAAITTKYDTQRQPIEVFYYGPAQDLVARKILAWDPEGRLAKDELHLAFGEAPEPDAIPHWETTYTYDSDGRCRERSRTMGQDFEVRTAFAYDDHGNVIESIDSGKLERRGLRHIRYEYRYDDRGNWIERVTLSKLNSEFQPTVKETRYIAY